MKYSKQNYFTKYFESNIKNLKNTWKGIKSITLKNSASLSLILLNFNNKSPIDPLKIANILNNYFTSIGKKTQPKISFWHKHYTDYLHSENVNSFLLYLETVKVISIISWLSENKSTSSNSIPTRILELLKKDISTQLVKIFYLFFFRNIRYFFQNK